MAAVLGESTITATGGPPAGNRVMVSARAADTDGVTLGSSAPALTATPNWAPLPPGASGANVTAEPTTVAKKGWLFGLAGGTLTPLDSIASGTWTASVIVTPNALGAVAFAVGMRAYQVSADMATTTVLTLTTPTGGSAGANGWVYAAAQTASLGAALTFTLTMASVGAVTTAAATKHLYVEFALKFNADDTLAQTYALTSFTLTVPALAFSRTPAESQSVPSEAIVRAFVGVRTVGNTLSAATEAITRAFVGTRVPADSTPAASEAITRAFVGARTPADSTPAGSDAVTRAFVGTRTIAQSTPAGSDAVTRTYNATRAVTDSVPAGSDAVTRTFVGVRTLTETDPVVTDAPTRVFTGVRTVANTLSAPTEAVTRLFGATRLPADSVPAGTDAVTRTFSANRAIAQSTPAGSDSPSRIVAFGRVPTDSPPAITDAPNRTFSAIRTPREYLSGGTPDWPLNAPTKTLAGVTRDSGGAALGSCTVQLIRLTDMLLVATTTSDSVTGAYSFVRGGDDPWTYTTIARAPGSPQRHGISDTGLVPV